LVESGRGRSDSNSSLLGESSFVSANFVFDTRDVASAPKKSSILKEEFSISVFKTGGRSFKKLAVCGAVTAEIGVEMDESLPVLRDERSCRE